jgi:hypothetical protein
MNANEILDRIDKYLDQHLDPKAPRGSIYQDPYKGDFFKLCLEAYRHGYFETNSSPRLTGDAMADRFYERWMSLDQEHRENKFKLLKNMIAMWDEWHYTLENIHYEKAYD